MKDIKDIEKKILFEKKTKEWIANTLNVFSIALTEMEKSMKQIFSTKNWWKNQITKSLEIFEKKLIRRKKI